MTHTLHRDGVTEDAPAFAALFRREMVRLLGIGVSLWEGDTLTIPPGKYLCTVLDMRGRAWPMRVNFSGADIFGVKWINADDNGVFFNGTFHYAPQDLRAREESAAAIDRACRGIKPSYTSPMKENDR